jgi:chromosome segregation ATPase
MASTDRTARKIAAEGETRPSVNEAGIDALMRELIHKKPSDGKEEVMASTAPASTQSAPRRDFDMATELLERAGQAFDLLIDRCQALERDSDDANERAQARAAEQDETIERWKQLASELKAQLESTEQTMLTLRKRCDAVQARAVKAEETVRALEATSSQAAAHAALAENLSTKLHDKVVSAFGIGSRAHPVLEAVATRAGAQ